MRTTFFLFIFSLLFSLSISGQTRSVRSLPKRIYTTKKLKKVPVIDGDITDDAWDVVEWSSDFTEKDPDEGTPPTYQTKFKIMYDKKFLYVAIRAYDAEQDNNNNNRFNQLFDRRYLPLMDYPPSIEPSFAF